MQPWPIFVVIWFCALLFVATGILSFLDTAGIRKIPYPQRSKLLFSALLLEVVVAGAAVFKHYTEQGSLPIFFSNPSIVSIEKVLELPISEQHNIEVAGTQGGRLQVFCKDIKVGKQVAFFVLSSDGVAQPEMEVPIHASKQFVFEHKTYSLRLDGVIDWKQRADEAFISILPATSP